MFAKAWEWLLDRSWSYYARTQPAAASRWMLERLRTPPQGKVLVEASKLAMETMHPRDVRTAIRAGWERQPTKDQIKLRRAFKPLVPLDYEPRQIVLGCESLVEYEMRTRAASKEPELVRWIEESFRPGDVFYDIGANVGAYSLIAAARYGSDIRIVAFEPSYPTFARLVDNMFLNHFEAVITPLPFALGRHTAASHLLLSNLHEGRAFNYLDSYVADGEFPAKVEASDIRRQPVLVQALDDCIRTYGLPPPTVCKIDVDGFELPLLEGAAGVLADRRLRALHVELNREDAGFPGILALFERHGFTVARSTTRGERNANVEFVRPA